MFIKSRQVILFLYNSLFSLGTFGERGVTKPSAKEVPYEINNDTHETREER